MWPGTRTLLFSEPGTYREPWEGETRAVCQCITGPKDSGVRRKGALRPAPHYHSCQTRDERPHSAMKVLLKDGFSSLNVACTAQLSSCFLRATVALYLSSRGLCCRYIAIFHQSKLSLARPGGSWGHGLLAPRAAESSGLLCVCSFEGAPTACGM